MAVKLFAPTILFLCRNYCSLSEGSSLQMRKNEQADQVRAAIESMQVVDREVLLLRHVEELTNSEVAEVLQIEVAAASQRYGRALHTEWCVAA